jgi:hypothetical protein
MIICLINKKILNIDNFKIGFNKTTTFSKVFDTEKELDSFFFGIVGEVFHIMKEEKTNYRMLLRSKEKMNIYTIELFYDDMIKYYERVSKLN